MQTISAVRRTGGRGSLRGSERLTSVQGSSFVWFLILPFSHTAKTRNGVDDADVCFVKVYRKKMRMFDDLIDFSPFCFLIYKR